MSLHYCVKYFCLQIAGFKRSVKRTTESLSRSKDSCTKTFMQWFCHRLVTKIYSLWLHQKTDVMIERTHVLK